MKGLLGVATGPVLPQKSRKITKKRGGFRGISVDSERVK
jgi:hypothetical protein